MRRAEQSLWHHGGGAAFHCDDGAVAPKSLVLLFGTILAQWCRRAMMQALAAALLELMKSPDRTAADGSEGRQLALA